MYKEIKALFPVTVWNQCPTNKNPADLLTRGITTQQLHTSSLWQHGPQWLPLVEQWPSWNSSKILHLHLCDAAANNTKTTTDGATQADPAEKQPGTATISLMFQDLALSPGSSPYGL